MKGPFQNNKMHSREVTHCLRYCVAVLLFVCNHCLAQHCGQLKLALQSEIPTMCSEMTVTMIHDQLDRPYLYVANKEAGLRIYNIANSTAPVLVSSVPIREFENLEVMSVTQDGPYLFLALGNTFITPQRGGMSIIDVTDPLNPIVSDYYTVPGVPGGGGIVKVEGNYAYLGAMSSGLIILDVVDKTDIRFVSQFVPDIHYPPIANPDTLKINARGLEVFNSIVYLCYDAGGFRIIDCTNKKVPKEIGRYCNPVLYQPFNLPRAYNNVVVDSPFAYVSFDYCGLEVLDISNPASIKLHGWWNPYNCPFNNWFNSPSHTNELVYDPDCKLLFVATGKSDMIVLDVSNPATPDSCNYYGGPDNKTGTWGIGRYKNEIFLSYVCVPIPWPFPSNWTGVKILSYESCLVSTKQTNELNELRIYPNPSSDGSITFELVDNPYDLTIEIIDLYGRQLQSYSMYNEKIKTISTDLSPGLYAIKCINKKSEEFATRKLWLNAGPLR